MLRTALVATFSILLVVSMATSPVFALPEFHFGKQLSAKQCKTDDAKKIIDVTQKILNDVDSGVAGNNWAFDNFERQIQVWKLSDNTFCAITHYDGHFVTVAGPSPGGTNTVTAGIKGDIEGGYRTTLFTGTLLSSPTKPTHGDIGVFDYQCDISGTCPGFVDWTTLYFSSTSGFDLAWWGWQYHAGKHGSWINAIDGNSGDITG